MNSLLKITGAVFCSLNFDMKSYEILYVTSKELFDKFGSFITFQVSAMKQFHSFPPFSTLKHLVQQ